MLKDIDVRFVPLLTDSRTTRVYVNGKHWADCVAVNGSYTISSPPGTQLFRARTVHNKRQLMQALMRIVAHQWYTTQGED